MSLSATDVRISARDTLKSSEIEKEEKKEIGFFDKVVLFFETMLSEKDNTKKEKTTQIDQQNKDSLFELIR